MAVVIKGVGLAAALCCAAIGYAGAAAAEEDPAGTYTRIIDGGGSMMQSTVTYTPCGPGCLHGQTSGSIAYDVRQQGVVWIGEYALSSGTPCTVTFDPAALTERHVCTDGTDGVMKLFRD